VSFIKLNYDMSFLLARSLVVFRSSSTSPMLLNFFEFGVYLQMFSRGIVYE